MAPLRFTIGNAQGKGGGIRTLPYFRVSWPQSPGQVPCLDGVLFLLDEHPSVAIKPWLDLYSIVVVGRFGLSAILVEIPSVSVNNSPSLIRGETGVNIALLRDHYENHYAKEK